jgi:hypothetical protein
MDPPNLRLVGRMVADPSSRSRVTVQRSPFRTHDDPDRSLRSLHRVITRSPSHTALPSCRGSSRAGLMVPSMIRSARALWFRAVTDC